MFNHKDINVNRFLLMLVGGAVLEDGDGTDLAQVYNPKTAVWTEVAPMQIARSGSAACTLKGRLYVIGNAVVPLVLVFSRKVGVFSD